MLVTKTLFLASLIAMCYGFNHKVDKALESFIACDTDNNDLVTLKEFSEFFKSGGLQKLPITRTIEDAEYNANFNLMDVNSDKNLDQREFTIGFTLYTEFSSYDINKDFFLSEDELVEAFNAPNGPAGDQIAFVEFLARIINDLRLSF